MQRYFNSMLGLLAVTLAIAVQPAVAQSRYQDVQPLSASCITEFWDHQMYGWLAYQNNCGQPIHLLWYGKIRGGAYSDDVRAGGKTNTGFSPQEVNERGGFTVYVCPLGYIPVDSGGELVRSAYSRYTCRRE